MWELINLALELLLPDPAATVSIIPLIVGGIAGGVAAAENSGGKGFAGVTEDTLRYQADVATGRYDPREIAARREEMNRLDALAAEAQGYDMRGQRAGAIAGLRDAAFGTGGPSAAEALLGRGMNQGMNQQLALAASAQGANRAAARRQAAFNNAAIAGDTSAQMAALRAQEQQTARGQLAQALSQGVSADDAYATNLMNQGLERDKFTTGVDIQNEANRAQAAENYYSRTADIYKANIGAETSRRGQDMSMASDIVGGVTQAAGAAGAAGVGSDKRGKKDVRAGGAEEFLEALKAYGFEYKDPSGPAKGAGPQLGVMAQDVEKSDLGDDMVVDGQDGKELHTGKALGPVLAALANLHERMKAQEGDRG